MMKDNDEQKMENTFTDEQLEQLFKIVSHYMMSELEELTPFDERTPEECENILKVTMKSIETTTMVMKEFLKPDALDWQKVEKAHGLLQENKMKEAHAYIFGQG